MDNKIREGQICLLSNPDDAKYVEMGMKRGGLIWKFLHEDGATEQGQKYYLFESVTQPDEMARFFGHEVQPIGGEDG